MSLSKIRMSDLYFTMDGRVLLSIDGDLLALERLVAEGGADFLRSILNEPGMDLAVVSRGIIADSQSLYDLVRTRGDAVGEVHHDGCVYHFSRLPLRADVVFDGALFHLRRLEAQAPDLAQLGLSPGLIWHIEQSCGKAGLVVATGLDEMRRAAVSSSLLSLLLRAQGKLAWTLESRPAYRLAGLYNNAHHEGYCVQAHISEMSWGETVHAACRSGAYYILIDEIKESECAAQALTAACSGHLVLLGLYAETIPEALSRLADYAAPVLTPTLAHQLIARSFLAAFGSDGESALFGGSAESVARRRIAAGKWTLLISDIESQMGRIRHGQPLFV